VAERAVINDLLDAQKTGVSMTARDLLPLFDVKRKCVEPFIILEQSKPTLTLGGRRDTKWTRCSWSVIKRLELGERGATGADAPVRLSPDVRMWRPVLKHWGSSSPEIAIMPAPIHAVVNDMVCGEDEHGAATMVLPVGDAYKDVAKWASGVDLLLTAVTSSPCAVNDGLVSLRALLIEMMQLSKFDLDADDRASFITTEEYVPDARADGLPMSDFERQLRTVEFFNDQIPVRVAITSVPNEPKASVPAPKGNKARQQAMQEARAAEGATDAVQKVCHKKVPAGNGLTAGLFTVGCAFCHMQLGFSVMDRAEGPSTAGRLIITRLWPTTWSRPPGLPWWAGGGVFQG
ncbi:hypothetical protein T484DRAFT_1826134, partial [Baffinella frigidus]